MKGKPTKFKNPFDLMEQQAQQMIETKPQPKFNSIPIGKIHTPLPFDPYQQPTNDQSSLNSSKVNQTYNNYPSISKDNKKVKNKQGFSNSFGGPEQINYQETQSNSMTGPIGFNPQKVQQAPTFVRQSSNVSYQGELNQDGDPPLLEDLGIDLNLIKQRIRMTALIQRPDYQQLKNSDLAGPICIAMLFGCLLLFSGKIHFGDIYAMFVFGNSLMYFLINYMSQSDIIPLYNVMSTLGYSLMPMLILGFLGIFLNLTGTIGILVSLSMALWSSLSAGNFLQVLLRQPNTNRKALISYPLFLFYLCFGMIVIF